MSSDSIQAVKGAGIRIKLKLNSVIWTDYSHDHPLDFHGINLRRHDRAAKLKIVKMLRAMPKKWNRHKGRLCHIYALSEVDGLWY